MQPTTGVYGKSLCSLCNFSVNIKLFQHKRFIHKGEGAVVKWNQYNGGEILHTKKNTSSETKGKMGRRGLKTCL